MADKLPSFEDTEELPSFEQTEELPSFDATQELSQEEQSPLLTPSGDALLKGAGAGVATEAARRGISAGTEKLIKNIGALTPEQMSRIQTDPNAYRSARPISETLQDYKQLAEETRQAGFDFTKKGKESLKTLPNIKGQEVIEALSKITEAPLVSLSPENIPKAQPNEALRSNFENLLKQKQELQNTISEMTATGVESPAMSAQISEASKKLAQVESRLPKLQKQILQDVAAPVEPTLAQFSKATNFPEEILQANPALKTKAIDPKLAQVLKERMDILGKGELSAFDVGDKLVPGYQDAASYSIIPDETNKFKQELARNVSEMLKQKSPEFKKGQELSKKAIETEQGLKDFGIKLDENTGEYFVSNDNKIANIYKKGNQSQVDRLQALLQQAEELKTINGTPLTTPQTLANITSPLASELPLSAIKSTVESAKDTGISRLAKGALGAAVGSKLGPIGAAGGAALATSVLPTGTKLQELASLVKGSQAFKTAAKASKFLGPAAALATAGLAYSDPRLEELSSTEKAGTVAGEVLNPIPFTDVTGAVTEGKKEFQKTGEVLPSIAKAGKAYAKPLEEATKEFGKGRAEKIAQNYQVGKVYQPQEKIANLEDLYNKFKSMVSSKGAEAVTPILESALTGTEEEKAKAEFQINQNPWLRNQVNKN